MLIRFLQAARAPARPLVQRPTASHFLNKRFQSTSANLSKEPTETVLEYELAEEAKSTKSQQEEQLDGTPDGVVFRRIQKPIKSFNTFYADPSAPNVDVIPELENGRVVPSSPAFFCVNPSHEDRLDALTKIANKYTPFFNSKKLDEIQSEPKWLSVKAYKLLTSDLSTTRHHSEIIELLNKLDSISVQFRNPEINSILSSYREAERVGDKNKTVKYKDANGISTSVGRRKTSSSNVRIVEGEGIILVNGDSLQKKFPLDADRLKIMKPLMVTNSETSYNIFALVEGGGKTGQVEAIALGIAKGLVIQDPNLEAILTENGCLKRDTRTVERKKPGKVKARKSPTWVKR